MKSVQILFRDVLLLLLICFVGTLLLLLPHINPPSEQSSQDITSPGSMIVEISWPDESNHDVDLWVRGPDGVSVGYSSLSGPLFNLLRDDLGHMVDLMKLNYENAYSRGLPPGEYLINLHLFRTGPTLPVPVSVRVMIKRAPADPPVRIYETVSSLGWLGQELTVIRFRLDEDGVVIPSSQNSAFESIRGFRQ